MVCKLLCFRLWTKLWPRSTRGKRFRPTLMVCLILRGRSKPTLLVLVSPYHAWLRGDKYKQAVMEDVESKLTALTSCRNNVRQALDDSQVWFACTFVFLFLYNHLDIIFNLRIVYYMQKNHNKLGAVPLVRSSISSFCSNLCLSRHLSLAGGAVVREGFWAEASWWRVWSGCAAGQKG